LYTVLVTKLINRCQPGIAASRRVDADWKFADVPAFVDALLEESLRRST